MPALGRCPPPLQVSMTVTLSHPAHQLAFCNLMVVVVVVAVFSSFFPPLLVCEDFKLARVASLLLDLFFLQKKSDSAAERDRCTQQVLN